MGVRALLTACMAGWVSVAQAAGGLYLGASVGLMDANIGGFDEATNAGALLGYEFFNKDIVYLSAEAEFTTSVSDGDVKLSDQKGKWDIDTQAAYLAVRVGDTLYAKVRYGLAWVDVSVKAAGRSFNDSDSGGSWGAAFGWNFAERWGVQADGVVVDSDVDYWNLGLVYRF